MYSIPRKDSAAAEIVCRVKISDVWQALGGDPPKRGRAKAFFRGGDGLNISLDDSKGAWYDFRENTGGGILALIQLVQDCTKKDALKWLADYQGVSLDSPLTPSERRDYARRRAAAEQEGRALVAWRNDLIESIREYRDLLFTSYHGARRFLRDHPVDDCIARGDWRWELAFDIMYTYWPRIEDLDNRIDTLKKAAWSDLLPYFRARHRRAA